MLRGFKNWWMVDGNSFYMVFNCIGGICIDLYAF